MRLTVLAAKYPGSGPSMKQMDAQMKKYEQAAKGMAYQYTATQNLRKPNEDANYKSIGDKPGKPGDSKMCFIPKGAILTRKKGMWAYGDVPYQVTVDGKKYCETSLKPKEVDALKTAHALNTLMRSAPPKEPKVKPEAVKPADAANIQVSFSLTSKEKQQLLKVVKEAQLGPDKGTGVNEKLSALDKLAKALKNK